MLKEMKTKAINLLALIVLSLTATEVQANGSFTLGGSLIDSSNSTTVNSSYKQHWENDSLQYDIDSTFNYQTSNGDQTTNKYYVSAKSNYTFKPKQYVFALASIDHDRFRPDEQRIITGIGYGYKLLRTERIKASNEFSFAQLESDFNSKVIWRNSLWFNFKLNDKLSFVNKFLVEDGDYIRNQTDLSYKFDNGISFGVGNLYTEDDFVDDNIFSFNVGYNW
jgi:putative salt-induced outer membrane protein